MNIKPENLFIVINANPIPLFMQKKKLFIFFALVALLLSAGACNRNDEPTSSDTMYFPPLTGQSWDTVAPSKLGWHPEAIPALLQYLQDKHSKSFMILVDGRIAMEQYFDGHTATTTWPWNSAGKTLVSASTGIAQQEGLLNSTNRVSDYLGAGWTSEPLTKERLITVQHLLSMTSGLNDTTNLVLKSTMTYRADAGTRWSYSNVFQKLMDVVASVSGQTFDAYFDNRIKNKIGMDGFWNHGLIFTIYHSSTRSMARFGLLALNKGNWNGTQLINSGFLTSATSGSQTINPSYGYLWWLNGKASYMVPGGQTVYNGPLVPNAPSDMVAAMGASDQRIYVVPSRNMVIVRMGDASDPDNPEFAVSGFDNELWAKINAVLN